MFIKIFFSRKFICALTLSTFKINTKTKVYSESNTELKH